MNMLTIQSNDYTQVLGIIVAADLADSTKRKYTAVLDAYLVDGRQLTDRKALTTYAQRPQ